MDEDLKTVVNMIRKKAEQHEQKNGIFAAQGFHGLKSIAVGRSASGSIYALIQNGDSSKSFVLDWVEVKSSEFP